ncbi:Riboflavin synthase [Halomicronema hongdechloris C2206]|uniref:Riboflavin synthase n=1 Tax=Halomicronema hongdechloris C2206 TaxID=1641165 RepID=A0A1Z3HKY6_9CYAN|nr:riboflavin synthase [Halomicronema hongdechloris]ASC70982.1 Riboflavin synthase [Halomicronema hongdechloris C2206]
MFTGLIQALGRMYPVGRNQLRIHCPQAPILADLALGDSIAVDGVCLTVEQQVPQGFLATASPETLDRSTLGQQAEGSWVNLEASLRVGSKIGGHFVTGHVDGWGYLDTAAETGNAWEISFSVPNPKLARYLVPQGSIAVNGISLTVADCGDRGNWFRVAVIPVTYRETTLQYLRPGQAVNLEGDILGKYVERFLHRDASAAIPQGVAIDLDFLADHGYL